MALVKALPKSEDGSGMLCKTKSNGNYVISHNTSKEKNAFTLWKKHGENAYEKICVGNTPQTLMEKIDWK